MLSYRKLKTEPHLCEGVRPGHRIPCNGTTYKCKACGNLGCRQTVEGRCTHQGFNVVTWSSGVSSAERSASRKC